jgi:hypothetical protein
LIDMEDFLHTDMAEADILYWCFPFLDAYSR